MFVIVDECSRFPFVYACKDMKTSTVIKKLTDLFCVFGFSSYTHSDQGFNFMSFEFKSWLHSKGIPTSRTTRYNSRRNGQVERYNGIIWKTVLLALRSKQLPPHTLEVCFTRGFTFHNICKALFVVHRY